MKIRYFLLNFISFTPVLILTAFLSLGSIIPAHATQTVTYYHSNALGSPVAATDEAGNVLWREAYEPYGLRLIKDANSSGNSRYFTGHPEDSSTGLTYMGSRFYDSRVGRFLSPDPQRFKETNRFSFNRYAYANLNPYKFIDPNGEDADWGIHDPEVMGGTGGAEVLTETGQVVVQAAEIGTYVVGGVGLVKGGLALGKGLLQMGAARGLRNLFKNGRTPKASELKNYAEQQGWKSSQTANGPLKYTDKKSVNRLTIKQGSNRAPGSGNPHVELRNNAGQRIDPTGNPVARKSPGNHTPIDFDL